MNKAVPGIIIAVVVVAAALALSLPGPPENKDEAFHVILADPALYEGGAFAGTFFADAGQYRFGFVPNGSSPQTLSITLSGSSVEFARDFELVGTPHNSDAAEYFTWDYEGEDYVTVSVPEEQEVSIVIDPNGDTMGSVSVFVLKN